MDTAINNIPSWLPAYWVNVTVVRLLISMFVIYLFGRTALVWKPSARTIGISVIILLLAVWVGLAIYLSSLNFFRIDFDTPLPPPIAAAALIPIISGYAAFQYWPTFRRIIFSIPQHWLIALQAYRMTGGVFLVVYALGLIPGVFALTAGIGDFTTGALAIPVAYFCYRQTPWAARAARAWNYLGLAELIILIPFGLLSSPSPIQVLALDNPNLITSTWPSVLAPTFHVPLGILMHIYSLALLNQGDKTTIEARPSSIAWQLMLFGAVGVAAYVALFYIASPLLAGREVAYQVYPGLQQILASQPIPLYLHIIPALAALLIGPFQLLESFRTNHWRLHRLFGRIYLFCGVLIGGLGALYIAQFSFAGMGARLGFSVQAILLLITGYMAYVTIRQRRIEAHQAWVIRSYALIFGAVTLRIYIRTFFWLGYDLPDFHAINAWLCWVPNLLVAEWIIHRRRTGPNKKQPLHAVA